MFESFEAFLEMGGFGSYVWPSYAICVGSLIVLTWMSVLTIRRRRTELDALEGSRERRAASRRNAEDPVASDKPKVQNA